MDGGSSLALAYKNPSDTTTVVVKGSKHYPTPPPFHYCVNTFLIFNCDKPRP
jgi:hypothetical protein